MVLQRDRSSMYHIGYALPILSRGMKTIGDDHVLYEGRITRLGMIIYANEQVEMAVAASTTMATAAAAAAATATTTAELPSEPISMIQAAQLLIEAYAFKKAKNVDIEKKIKLLKRALTAFQSRAILLTNRAFCQLKLLELLDVLEDTHAALALDPTQVKAAYYQADAFYQLMKFEEAKSACQRGIKLAKNNQSMVTEFIHLARRITKAATLHVQEKKQSQQSASSDSTSSSTSTSTSTESSSEYWLVWKEQGNELLRTGSYDSAIDRFTHALAEQGRGISSFTVEGASSLPALLTNILIRLSIYYFSLVKQSLDRHHEPNKSDLVSAVRFNVAAKQFVHHSKEWTKKINLIQELLSFSIDIIDDSHVWNQKNITESMWIQYANEQTVLIPQQKTVMSAEMEKRFVELKALTGQRPTQVTVEGAIKLYYSAMKQCETNNTDPWIPELLRIALSAFKPRAAVLTNRALCYLKIDQPLLALYDTHTALVLNPTYAKAVYHQAEAFLQLKEYDAAKSACKNGIKLTKYKVLLNSFVQLGRRVITTESSSIDHLL